MAVNMPGAGVRGGNRKFRYTRMSEINVTPFVDVMLVLLIVFMVTAPLLTVGVPLELPQSKAASITDTDEPLVISIDAAGDIYLQESRIELANLVARLQAVTGANADIRIFVRGDASIAYGQVMQVMGEVSAAGFRKVSLLSKAPDPAKKGN